jgi:dsRNA-specific ribonuclease
MDFDRVAIAITAKSCNPDENYDKWEYIGDAVLKLLQTDSLLKSPRFKHFVRFLHEGDLSMLRSGKSLASLLAVAYYGFFFDI